MGSESIGSCTGPPPSPFWEEPKYFQNAANDNHKKGACFACNQEGHWSKDCPSKRIPAAPPGYRPAAGGGAGKYPEIQCPCGRGPCIVLTSRTLKNPDRDFYRCPEKKIEEKCKFFRWCDELDTNLLQRGANSPMKPGLQRGINSPVKPGQRNGMNSPVKPGERHGVPDRQYPICQCQAGVCKLLTMEDGKFKGRKYFGCHVTKGQGACGHFQWYDTLEFVPELKKIHAGDHDFPNNNMIIEEPRNPAALDGMVNKVNGSFKSDSPPPPPRREREEIAVPESPPPSKREREINNAGLGSSPMKRLTLNDGSPSKPKKCLGCLGDGHLMSDCIHFRLFASNVARLNFGRTNARRVSKTLWM